MKGAGSEALHWAMLSARKVLSTSRSQLNLGEGIFMSLSMYSASINGIIVTFTIEHSHFAHASIDRIKELLRKESCYIYAMNYLIPSVESFYCNGYLALSEIVSTNVPANRPSN